MIGSDERGDYRLALPPPRETKVCWYFAAWATPIALLLVDARSMIQQQVHELWVAFERCYLQRGRYLVLSPHRDQCRCHSLMQKDAVGLGHARRLKSIPTMRLLYRSMPNASLSGALLQLSSSSRLTIAP